MTNGKSRTPYLLFVLLDLSFVICNLSFSATVTLGKPHATTEGGLVVPVTVAPGTAEAIGALQFDLHYDVSRYTFRDVAPGAAAAFAGKDAQFSEPSPGVIRVVVAGVNPDSMPSGDVATLYFEPLAKTDSASSFAKESSLYEVVVSDPYGSPNEARIGTLETQAESTTSTASGTTAASASSNSKATSSNTAAAGGPFYGYPQAGGYGSGLNGDNAAGPDSRRMSETGAVNAADKEPPSRNASTGWSAGIEARRPSVPIPQDRPPNGNGHGPAAREVPPNPFVNAQHPVVSGGASANSGDAPLQKKGPLPGSFRLAAVQGRNSGSGTGVMSETSAPAQALRYFEMPFYVMVLATVFTLGVCVVGAWALARRRNGSQTQNATCETADCQDVLRKQQ